MNDKDRVNRVYERYSHKHIRILLPDVIHSRFERRWCPPAIDSSLSHIISLLIGYLSGLCATKFIHKSVISRISSHTRGVRSVGEVAEKVKR